MRSRIQFIIIIIGICSLGISIRQFLQMQTMILPPWFLLLIPLPCIIGLAFLLGYVVKSATNSKWMTMTFAAMFLIMFCSVYYVSKYKKTYKVLIPEHYVGEVRLMVSGREGNEFIVNDHGIGYIDKRTFEEGFYPKIMKGGEDITKNVKEYSKGAMATSAEDAFSYEYLSFSIPGRGEVPEEMDIEELIKIKAIDTSHLYRK